MAKRNGTLIEDSRFPEWGSIETLMQRLKEQGKEVSFYNIRRLEFQGGVVQVRADFTISGNSLAELYGIVNKVQAAPLWKIRR